MIDSGWLLLAVVVGMVVSGLTWLWGYHVGLSDERFDALNAGVARWEVVKGKLTFVYRKGLPLP